MRHNVLAAINLGTRHQDHQSLPAYVYGVRLAQMIMQLEQIKCFGKG